MAILAVWLRVEEWEEWVVMKTVGSSPNRYARMRLSLATVALLLASACAASPPAGGSNPAGLALVPLLAAGDCDKMETRAPTPGERDDAALRQLASSCLARSNEVDSSQLSNAAAAHNAAQAYAELARRTSSPADLAAADEAAARSRALVSDVNVLTGRGEAASRLAYNRLAIQIASRLERGLSEADGASRSCDGRVACLDSALSLANGKEDVLQLAAQSASPALRADHSRLQILRARGEAALAGTDGYGGNVDRALSLLEGVIARERIGATAQSAALLASARSALSGIVTAEAERLLAGEPTAAAIQQAVGYLERGARQAEGGSASALQVEIGQSYAHLAAVRDGTNEAALSAGDLCKAATAFDAALKGDGTLPVADRVAALAGRGAAIAGLLESPRDACRADIGAMTEARALADLDAAWRLANGQHVTVGQAVTYAGLLLKDEGNPGARDQARAVLDQFQSAGGEPAMRMNLLLARETSSEVEALGYFDRASAAYPPSPLPELERAKYLIARGESGRASVIEASLARAAMDAEGDPKYAAQEAEAYYYRSLVAAPGADAVRWAERAVQGDSTQACYEYQACRAHLMARRKAFGEGAEYCSANPATPAGAMFNGLGVMRQSQIARRKDPGFLSAFRPAEDAFRDASQLFAGLDEAERSALPECPALDARIGFPDGAASTLSSYDRVARYGVSFARGCGTRGDEAVPELDADLVEIGSVFAGLGLTACNDAR